MWSLFLMCAFPVHVWTILLALRDFEWVTERTNSWDAIGVLSYGLLFAFVESLLIFALACLAGFFISTFWDEPHRIALLSSWVLVLAGYAVYVQAASLWGASLPASLLHFAASSAHPIRVLYLTLLGPVALTITVPVLLILYWRKFFTFIQSLFERISLLAAMYLFLDAASLIIVVIRNFQ